jgi:Fic family protein
MDWHALDQVVLHPSTERLLDDVRRGLDEVNRLRPLHPNLVESVTADLLADRVYNSNAVEGNPLDLRETRRILEAGHQLAEEKRSRSELEVINLGAAVGYFERELVPSERPHQTANLLALHAILMKDVEEDAGRFRHKDVMVRGAKYQPPDPSRVEELIERAFGELEAAGESVDPVVAAAWVHWAIARIHPFFDGNGRTARLWQDLVLLQSRATCAIIRPEERTQYYNALQEADEGRFDALVLLVAERVAWTIDRIVFAAAARERMKDWAGKLAGELGLPSFGELRVEFLQWTRRLQAFVDALYDCAQAVGNVSPDIHVELMCYEFIKEWEWQNLRWKHTPTNPRFLQMRLFIEGRGRGTFELKFGDWFKSAMEGPDSDMGDCASLNVTVVERFMRLDPEHDDSAMKRDEAGNETTIDVLVSSKGVHLLTWTRRPKNASTEEDSLVDDKILSNSVDRFIEPLEAAQRVIQFVVEVARSSRDH